MRKTRLHFDQYLLKARTVSSPVELLPGLNDISDAFEALPMEMVKYLTLLKEIDAKCTNTIPRITRHIQSYLDDVHSGSSTGRHLDTIGHHIHAVIPCLEEKMHVTTVAADVMQKHMHRINNDYRMVVANNEVPELVRVGPLTHPAMVADGDGSGARTAQLARSESRREALAAKKVVRDDDDRKRRRDASPHDDRKKKRSDESRASTPAAATKKRTAKPRRDDDGGHTEPTYCYCNQVSFGEMVGCDGADCKREWFHLPCIGFKNPPKGRWYCDDCLVKMKKRRV